MGQYMAKDKAIGFAGTEGFERARLGNYAFISESPTAEYQVNQGCDLVVVGKPFRTSYFAFGFPPITGSPLKKRVDAALLHLEESSTMDTLKKKWWQENAKSCKVGCILSSILWSSGWLSGGWPRLGAGGRSFPLAGWWTGPDTGGHGARAGQEEGGRKTKKDSSIYLKLTLLNVNF